MALSALAFAAGAQAVTYTTGVPLITGKLTSGVAVNQSTGDVYATSSGVTAGTSGEVGSLSRFSAAGAELPCTLNPAPMYPTGVAIDQSSGRIYSFDSEYGIFGGGEVRAYEAGCGDEVPAITGTANATSGSAELTGVTTDHPLGHGQGISGPGIPTGTFTGDAEVGSHVIKNVSVQSGKLAVGQSVVGPGILEDKITAILSPTEVEVGPEEGWGTVSGSFFTARTTVQSVTGSTVTLSNPAEATGAGVAIEGTAWFHRVYRGQSTVDSSGDILGVESQTLQKFRPWGEEVAAGGFPRAISFPESVALDAKGDVYLTGQKELSERNCTATTAYRLQKLNPEGEELPEGGPIGAESVFAGLTEHAVTVAVDQKTGNVYVGIGCGPTFKIEQYGPGGTKLAEFGAGEFGAQGGEAFFSQLAIDEASGTVYAGDPGNTAVQVFEDTTATRTLATSVSPAGAGEVQCNETGQA
ncbi:MAG TPA: hypothetical protein VHZ54_13355, partial [Solirubrobacterales bacterium]|nr:hypothetical protein [Solirubrobacterales bacterium]